jgi:type IV pilus assembly protein PilN
MRISLNLATKPYADLAPLLKKLRIAMAAIGVVAIALGFGVHALDETAATARARERAVEAQIARVNQERQGYQALMRRPENAAVLAQAENLNQLFDEKAFSWTLAMEDLETVLPGGVQVTTLEPTRDKDGHITLHLRVVGPRDRAIQMVENLEHSRRFLSPRIAGESSESTAGPNQRVEPVSASSRVTFEVLADYMPPKPGERKATKPTDHGTDEATSTLGPVPPGAHRPSYLGSARPHAPAQAHPPLQQHVGGQP